jgi:RecB family endonuclease NucS
MAKIIFESEKELENWICEMMDVNNTCPITGNEIITYKQQYKIGNYGIADIIQVKKTNEDDVFDVTIIELKKEIITKSAVLQIARYMKGINEYVNHYLKLKHPNIKQINTNFILVAPEIDLTDETTYLIDACNSLSFYRVKYDLHEGVVFNEEHGWFLKDGGLDKIELFFDADDLLLAGFKDAMV